MDCDISIGDRQFRERKIAEEFPCSKYASFPDSLKKKDKIHIILQTKVESRNSIARLSGRNQRWCLTHFPDAKTKFKSLPKVGRPAITKHHKNTHIDLFANTNRQNGRPPINSTSGTSSRPSNVLQVSADMTAWVKQQLHLEAEEEDFVQKRDNTLVETQSWWAISRNQFDTGAYDLEDERSKREDAGLQMLTDFQQVNVPKTRRTYCAY